LAKLLDELETIHVRERGVRQDEIGLVCVKDLEGFPHGGTSSYVVTGVPEAHFENTKAPRIGIDDEEVLFGHFNLGSAKVCEAPHFHVKHAFKSRTW
jgi:hypothetical protein